MNAGPAGSLAAAAWELAVPELPFGLEGTQEEADLAAEDEQVRGRGWAAGRRCDGGGAAT